MEERKKKITLWCLAVLVVILIVIIGTLIILAMKNKKGANPTTQENSGEQQASTQSTEANQQTETKKEETEQESMVTLSGATEEDKTIGVLDLYNKAMELYNDKFGTAFKLSSKKETFEETSEDGSSYSYSAREVLNADEVLDEVFSANGKQVYKDYNFITKDGVLYKADAAGGSDATYWGTELELRTSNNSKREYTAKSRYIDWSEFTNEELERLYKNPDEFKDMFTYSTDIFSVVKENDKWLVEDFTMPN
ncbi:MAG: hypothetical protein IKP28_01525 [Clostridia bacterium]|nr:hypothetical protein [Clostridia bacterium]